MSSSWETKQGPNFVPSYQVSGTPYAETKSGVGSGASDAVKFRFPYVTRWVTISGASTTAQKLRIGFSKNGVDGNPDANYYLLELQKHDTNLYSGETERLELRCKELWVRGDAGTIAKVSVVAGLTGIESFPVLTGSNGFEGVG